MENINYFNLGLGLTVIISVPCIGYLSYLYVKKRIIGYALNKIVDHINENNNEQYFKPISKNSAMITFNRLGKIDNVYVPYNRRNSSIMLTKNIYLVKKGEKTLLNQNPGIPFMVSASDLGGEEILVEDKEGNIIKRFEQDEIPRF